MLFRSQIKALQHSAMPRNYEIWYAYATGHNAELNKSVNETLARSGTLTDAQLVSLHETYLSPGRASDRIENVESRVVDEIAEVIAMIEATVGSANNHSVTLKSTAEKLGVTNNREGLAAIVESLLATANEMKETNVALEQRLKASKDEIGQLQKQIEVVRNESLTDPLTGLANRKQFNNALELAIANFAARREPLSLVMVDVDHFKAFNDSWGHQTGDNVLRLVAASLKQNVKGKDTVARYGGEEFVMILPNTDLKSAVNVADQVRRMVMAKELMKRSTGQNLGRVTISLGVSTIREGDTAKSLIARADECLYAAKRNGRNRVICETEVELAPAAQAKVA